MDLDLLTLASYYYKSVESLIFLIFLEKTHKRKTKESLTCLQVKYILKQIYLKRGYASRGEEVSPERVLSCIEDT